MKAGQGTTPPQRRSDGNHWGSSMDKLKLYAVVMGIGA